MSRVGEAWFELTVGLPTAVRVLRRRLGGRWRRALLAYVRRAAGPDPFAGLDAPPEDAAERYSRQQMRPVLHLHAALVDGLGLPPDEAVDILRDVVGEAGARFLAARAKPPASAQWAAWDDGRRRSFVDAIVARFPNARGERVQVGDDTFSYDITRCRLAELARRIDRPDLGPLFCHADAVYFGDPAVGVDLERSGTLAKGDAVCDFRFRFRSQGKG